MPAGHGQEYTKSILFFKFFEGKKNKIFVQRAVFQRDAVRKHHDEVYLVSPLKMLVAPIII